MNDNHVYQLQNKKLSPFHEQNSFPWKAIELFRKGPEQLEIIICGRQTGGCKLYQLVSIYRTN